MQERLEEFQELGARVVAIAPDSQDSLAKLVLAAGVTFPVLADADSEVVKAYGVLNVEQGSLPHPAAFVVDADGVVRFRHEDPNYRERPDVAVLLAAVSALGGRTSPHGSEPAPAAAREPPLPTSAQSPGSSLR